MQDIIKEIKKLKKRQEILKKKGSKILESADVKKITSKSAKYITCQGCLSRFLGDFMRKNPRSFGRVHASCPACGAALMTKSKLKDLKENNQRKDDLSTRLGELNRELKDELEAELDRLRLFVANTEGTYRVDSWSGGTHGSPFELDFRNGFYASHESYSGYAKGDRDDLIDLIESRARKILPESIEVSCGYAEKEWFTLAVYIRI